MHSAMQSLQKKCLSTLCKAVFAKKKPSRSEHIQCWMFLSLSFCLPSSRLKLPYHEWFEFLCNTGVQNRSFSDTTTSTNGKFWHITGDLISRGALFIFIMNIYKEEVFLRLTFLQELEPLILTFRGASRVFDSLESYAECIRQVVAMIQ